MRVVFAGTPQAGVPALQALVRAGHEVVAAVTRPDAPTGRGRRLTASPVARAAAELGIEVLKPGHPRDAAFVERLTGLAPQVCAVVAYGALIPRQVLAIPLDGWVNLHFSLLPAWRGAAPVQRALMNGDEVTGVTTFRLVPALDAGPIYRQLRVPVPAEETAGELLERLAGIGADVLVETLGDITAGVAPVDQDEEAATTAPKVTPDEARIDWSAPAGRLAQLIRGTSPEPGAWTLYAGRRFKVLAARPDEPSARGAHPGELAPGQLGVDGRHLWAGTGAGALELIRVQGFGKRPMSGADWARGARPGAGARFDTDEAGTGPGGTNQPGTEGGQV